MKVPVSLARAIALATLVLFISSIARHILFQSNALDLGWFDQGIYLISRGKPPIVSFVGYHILGDHVALILYPIALLYKIYPSVYWLFLIQALALSIGAFPLWQLSVQAGVKERQALAVSIAYLLYPLVFNVNLFDFHPEVIAVPAIFWAVLAARMGRFWLFSLALLVIVSCKAILSLTVAGMGFWLLVFEKKRKCGSIALISGIVWFILTAKILIPSLTGKDAAAEMADSRYSYLGESIEEIIRNLFLSPDRVFSHLFTGANLEYLILLSIPIIPFLGPRTLAPLSAAIPALALNLLADYSPQKNITTQYSLPILPFLFLAVIATLANGGGWIRKPKWMILWATIAFVALAKYGYFWSRYLSTLDTWQATRQAVAAVKTSGAVLTTASIAPHLTHREDIQLAIEGSEKLALSRFEYIILDRRHPGWSSSSERIDFWLDRVRNDGNFTRVLDRDDVFFYKSVTKNDETE